MKRVKLFALTCAAIASIYSCGPKISTMTFNDANLNNYNSFAYLPNTTFDVEKQMGTIDETVGEEIIAAVNSSMVEEGYNMNVSNPDILVLLTTTYDTEIERDVELQYAQFPNAYNRPLNPYYSTTIVYDNYKTYPVGFNYDVDYEFYKEGTLIIELFDRENKNILWRGIAEDYISKSRSRKDVLNMVEELFEKFPR